MNPDTRFVLVNSGHGLNRSPTLDEIAELAFGIYQEDGCPDARADEHWFAAGRFLKREMFTCN
jgi:hypothetical protein